MQEVAKMWALLIPQKMQIIKGREGVFSNDLAIMAFQLTKLQLSDITDVYIYLENQLIESSSKLGFQPLFMLLQSFGQHGMHSQKLYLTVLEKVYQLSNAFERMNPLEFSILLSCLSQGIIKNQSPEINNSVRSRIAQMLAVDQEREVMRVGATNFRHPFERMYSSLINMEGDFIQEKDKITHLLSQNLDKCDFDHSTFFLWCLVMDDRPAHALDIYSKHLLGKGEEVMKQYSKVKLNPIRTFYHALYLLKALHGDALTPE